LDRECRLEWRHRYASRRGIAQISIGRNETITGIVLGAEQAPADR
jgi:hypothetical protein